MKHIHLYKMRIGWLRKFLSPIIKTMLLFIFIFISQELYSQTIKGKILGKEKDSKEAFLPGAGIHWINTTNGVSADANGNFEISSDGITDKRIIISFTGYKTDTILITTKTSLKIVLKNNADLPEVNVVFNRDKMQEIQPVKSEMIQGTDLKKAACCNLGESFETNATVDVTFKDAVSGSKEIQVLGLSGAYTQILTENAPLIQGLGLTYGLNSIPGSQISSINIVKGPGSVIFGHESISGMVNVELKDPQKTDKLFLNLFLDDNLRKEINTDFAHHFSDHLSALVSVHADHFDSKIDRNKDGFTDMPLLTNISLMNKWKFTKRGWISQNSLKALTEQRMAGQTKFDFNKDAVDSSAYGQRLNTQRMEFYGRTGYVIPTIKYNSIGFQYSFVIHDQKGFYGFNAYNGKEQIADLRLIHNIALNEFNSLNTGFNFRHHHASEDFKGLNFLKNENVPGFFAENTFQKEKVIAFILGARLDYFGNTFYFTPKGNFKYSLNPKTDLRFSAGTGWKTCDMLAENPGIFASARKIIITETIRPEQAANFGINFTKRFTLNYRKGSFDLDLYKTIFTNKIIPDFESDSTSQKVVFSNLNGRSFSDNLQVELQYEIIKNLHAKVAYKFLDVYGLFNGKKTVQPLIPRDRVYANLYYESFNRKWTYSGTFQWYGQKRLPNSTNNPWNDKMNDHSPSYFTLGAQINRVFKNTELYLGCENILDFRQTYSIIDPNNPFGNYFDTGYVWGPLEGRKIYAGLRFKIK